MKNSYIFLQHICITTFVTLSNKRKKYIHYKFVSLNILLFSTLQYVQQFIMFKNNIISNCKYNNSNPVFYILIFCTMSIIIGMHNY